MSTTELLSAGRWTSEGTRSRATPVFRDLALVVAAGLVAAGFGFLLGRPVRGGLGVALVGSVAVALPRTVVLLLVLQRVTRPAVLTAAAVAEVVARFGLGMPGLLPTGVVAPVVAAVAADAVWRGTGAWRFSGARLALTGAVLAGTRVAAAWLWLAGAATLAAGTRVPPAAMGWAVLGVNVLLGAVAGLLSAAALRRRGEGR